MKNKFYLLLNLLFVLSASVYGQSTRIWATYYGGSGNDGGFSVATDNSGNVYMAGITMSANGIATNGSFQNTFGGGVVDAYLVKFDSAGNRQWATYYGGPGDEMAFFGGKMGVATDLFGNVFLAGFSSSTSGIATTGSFQSSPGGTAVNAYLAKFDASGNRLWATYYGGTSADKAYSVATDNQGNVYIAGIGGSTGLASGGFQNTSGGLSDAMLVKFDGNGNRLWATYYGGTGTEEGYSVVTDKSLNVYLAGTTTSTSGIASGGHQNTYGGGANDLFVVKFTSDGLRLWATYYGGTGDEIFLFNGDLDLATDAQENVFLTGLTSSTTNISSGGFQNTYGGGNSDAFLVKFDSAGVRQWATYYGGSDEDKGYNTVTDISGNVYVAGRTDSPNGISSGGFNNNQPGPHDAFLVSFTASGSRICGTYFGGSDVDECNAIALDNADNIYMGGNTANTSGISSGGFQNNHGGGTSDANLIKFTSCSPTAAVGEIFSDDMISIYPNPSDGLFKVNTNGMEAESILIYDVLGKLIYSNEDIKENEKIVLSEIKKGIYCAVVKTRERVLSKKVIIE